MAGKVNEDAHVPEQRDLIENNRRCKQEEGRLGEDTLRVLLEY